ncbi:Folate receptor-like [Trinorchestia longiramus]|nr:Folate receptor-like [Trinorchestia longiramus]
MCDYADVLMPYGTSDDIVRDEQAREQARDVRVFCDFRCPGLFVVVVPRLGGPNTGKTLLAVSGAELSLLVLIAAAHFVYCRDFMESCMNARHQKVQPGPESDLFLQCSPWRNRSCCTPETTRAVHETSHHPLNYNHCAHKRPLSDSCRRHFTQDDCFYECSPNVGPWLVRDDERPWREERFYGAPLCASDCDQWFNDCQYDLTCTDNWSLNFHWVTISASDVDQPTDGTRCKNNATSCKVNVCPKGSTCVTFLEMYGNASNFCETVWDGSWSYTPDNEPCMRLWFDGAAGNPNEAVAQLYASRLSGVTAAVNAAVPHHAYSCLVLIPTVLWMQMRH